jgi:hypothetical protein
MIQRFLLLREALYGFFFYIGSDTRRSEFSDIMRLRRPLAAEWFTIHCLSCILQPFASISNLINAQKYPTYTMIVPAVRAIRMMLVKREIFEDTVLREGNEPYVDHVLHLMHKVQDVILTLFDSRFKNVDKDEALWVSCLDPRLSRMTLPDPR